MKRGNIRNIVFLFVISLLFVIIIINSNALAQITGGATQSVGINITIVGSLVPNLTLHGPKNNTYLTNNSLLLNFTSSNAQAIWYNLDDSTNTTITTFIYFNTSVGSHRLYLFANSSNGTIVTQGANFTVNTTLFIIDYYEFQGALRGESTEFSAFSYEEIQNLTGIILDNIEHGKILFNLGINLTNISGNLLNLSENINISFNEIFLNSSALPNFDASATLNLYNLTFTTPRILLDGNVCSSTICTQNSYSNGTLNFNVTGFSTYSAEETPGVSAGPGGGGGGGGGGGATVRQNFEVFPEEFNVLLKPGEILEKEIRIRNKAEARTNIIISLNGLSEMVGVNKEDISLPVGGEETIFLKIVAPDEPGIYTAEIILRSADMVKRTPILVNVRSVEVLFDSSITIPKKYKVIKPGENLKALISISPIGPPMEIQVTINYIIKDYDNKEIYTERAELTILEEINFEKTFSTENLSAGNYIAGFELIYEEGFVPASASFSVKEPEPLIVLNQKTALYIIIALIILVIVVILWAMLKYKKTRGHIKKK